MKTVLVSLILSSFLVLNFLGFVEGHKQSDTRLNALESLIYNNAEATVKLDSTALRQLIQLSRTDKPRVSFSVYVKSKDLIIRIGNTAIYDGILTNDGNGYDVRTGVFTCPVAGTYMFVVDCLSHKPAWIDIVKNKTVVGSVHIATANDGPSYQQLSRTVIVKARKGDHVKVVGGWKSGYVHKGNYSGFSGTLLY
ncbi:complement C1q-like protein 4 [Ostrea edulis]|uniref:complement C1q-like protein 4 n=1 Tax=Ostrea edulis TaxID=37623 RepID=UPI0024AF86FC|nr:complement C1q-like protein 4 [Ostrea edulis]